MLTLSLLAVSVKTFNQFCFKAFYLGVALFGTLTLLSSCQHGDEGKEPLPAIPSITNFTPTVGLAGTTEVVITGENFSANAADDIVKIGSLVAVVSKATTTSITIMVPSNAISGKISVTIKGTTATSASDFIVSSGPSDFFKLTVDPSYETSDVGTWILASSKGGDWIDVQQYRSGDTKILNGVVPDGNSFTLHFLTISLQAGDYYFCSMKTITDVPINGTWLLKTDPATPPATKKILSLKFINYKIPIDRIAGGNDVLTVSTSEGGGGGASWSGNSGSVDVQVQKSPVDIVLTLYDSKYPRYLTYKNVPAPSTISFDASTDAVAADRNFIMTLPTNDHFYVAIDAFEKNNKFGYSMFNFRNVNGGTTVKLGYNQGYEKYRTLISFENGNRTADFIKLGPSVEETHIFPSFDFNVTKSNVNDFEAISTLPYDVSSTDFEYNRTGMILLWNVVQPPSGSSNTIAFKTKPFPQEILDRHPFLPSVYQVPFGTIYGHQFMGTKNYTDMINTASQSGNVLVDLYSDNVFRFGRFNK